MLLWSHPFIGIYFDNKWTNNMSFEMVSAIKLFIFKLFLLQQLLFQALEFVKMLRNLFKCKLIDMTTSMNGIGYTAICYVWRILWQWKPMSNLLMIDDSVLDYARILLFGSGLCVCSKTHPISRSSGNMQYFTTWFQSGYANALKKTNLISKKSSF